MLSEFAKLRAFRTFTPSCLTRLTRLCALSAFVPYALSRLTYLTHAPDLRALRVFFSAYLCTLKSF